MNATSNAASRRASYRPDEPPWPAFRFTLKSSTFESVFRVRSLATYFAGSQYMTWLSWSDVLTRIAGYAPLLRFVYGQYDRMYSYSSRTFGFPHSSNSPTVRGSVVSSMVFTTSTNGTLRIAARQSVGRRLTTAPMRRPPALPPSITIRFRAP